MSDQDQKLIETFLFRDLHPKVCLGTASDRYGGWLGQIYSRDKYKDMVSRRPKTVAGQSFTEGVLPVESVQEYFQHFSVLELDFTFYALLLDKDLKPTHNYHALKAYRRYMVDGDRLVLKVPQVIFAQKLRKGGKFEANPDYVNPDLFTHHFYEPAVEILGNAINGFIFEQEYQVKKERTPVAQYAEAVDQFFALIPRDERYHVEVRTDSLLTTPYLRVLEKHGVGQVLSHWTWLPPLSKQFAKGFSRFLNAGKNCVIRLMTPLGMRYEDAYIKAYPFDKLVEGMMSPQMVKETADLMISAIQQGIQANVIINNRAGGNAPLIAQKVAQKFSDLLSPSKAS